MFCGAMFCGAMFIRIFHDNIELLKIDTLMYLHESYLISACLALISIFYG